MWVTVICPWYLLVSPPLLSCLVSAPNILPKNPLNPQRSCVQLFIKLIRVAHAHSVQNDHSTAALSFSVHPPLKLSKHFKLLIELWSVTPLLLNPEKKVSVVNDARWGGDARFLSKSVIRGHPQISAGYGKVIHIKKL